MSEPRFTLLYDGECPFCRREADWLRRRDRDGHLWLADVTATDFDPSRYGATREDLLGVIHGVFPDGRIVRKLEAFRQAYRLVGLGWLLAPTGWPVLRGAFDGLYVLFARYRKPLGRLLGRRCASGRCHLPPSKPGGRA